MTSIKVPRATNVKPMLVIAGDYATITKNQRRYKSQTPKMISFLSSSSSSSSHLQGCKAELMQEDVQTSVLAARGSLQHLLTSNCSWNYVCKLWGEGECLLLSLSVYLSLIGFKCPWMNSQYVESPTLTKGELIPIISCNARTCYWCCIERVWKLTIR